jgi:hypothetical protein
VRKESKKISATFKNKSARLILMDAGPKGVGEWFWLMDGSADGFLQQRSVVVGKSGWCEGSA